MTPQYTQPLRAPLFPASAARISAREIQVATDRVTGLEIAIATYSVSGDIAAIRRLAVQLAAAETTLARFSNN